MGFGYLCLNHNALQVLVDTATFDRMENRWASPGGDVFQLVPPLFREHVSDHYNSLGSPAVSSNNLWTVYTSLLQKFRSIPPSIAMEQVFELQKNLDPMSCDLEVPLLPNLSLLRNNRYFDGLLDSGEGSQAPLSDSEEFVGPHRVFAEFSEDDEDNYNCDNNS